MRDEARAAVCGTKINQLVGGRESPEKYQAEMYVM